MAQFFRKSIDQHQFTGSKADLDLEREHFRQNQVSGVFEIQSKPTELEVLVLGDGEETGAYRLYPSWHTKITSAQIGSNWESQEVSIRSVALPDQASRALWQVMEYKIAAREEVHGLAGWKNFLDRSYAGRFTGMVGLTSELGDGFVFLQEGLLIPHETVFCSAEGFTSSIQTVEASLESLDQLTLYSADPSSQAYHCSLMRVGVVNWGKRILANYKDMVGQKLLHILNTSLNAMLMNQQSNIYLADIDIIDNHFFYERKSASGVYQSLFVNMSQLIGHVIGGMVTRRIMSTTFERLAPCEQEVLTTNTLAPAAFLR